MEATELVQLPATADNVSTHQREPYAHVPSQHDTMGLQWPYSSQGRPLHTICKEAAILTDNTLGVCTWHRCGTVDGRGVGCLGSR